MMFRRKGLWHLVLALPEFWPEANVSLVWGLKCAHLARESPVVAGHGKGRGDCSQTLMKGTQYAYLDGVG